LDTLHSWKTWQSDYLLPKAIQNIRLDLPPGLYVIRAAYTWDNKYAYDDDMYGFLVDVK
jgi:hypothetical protein